MMYTANVAVGSKIRTKHPTQSEHHVEFLNVKPGGT
jgi:desulfoferrodoxin (superoxide reductase-like protein)